MTDLDFIPFEAGFARVLTMFRLKVKPAEREELTRTYFKLLESHTLEAVLAAGRRCTEKLRQFPKAADWLAELPPTLAIGPGDSRWMTTDEAEALARATARCYDDEPCPCLACQAAGVATRPLRWVPNELPDGDLERAFNPRVGKLEVVGHWAHGDELARWYAARAAFMAHRRRPLGRILALIGGAREPGMEG